MKITIYELLGMNINELPKRIKYNNHEYHLYKSRNNSTSYYKTGLPGHPLEDNLFKDFSLEELNYTVEILEEEKKIPKKLYNREDYATQNACIDDIIRQFNNLIDYLKSKGE